MADDRPNPRTVGLEDIKRMRPAEFRTWTYLCLCSVADSLTGQSRRLSRIEKMAWGIVALLVASLLAAVFA